jgi:hypothetical protein
VSVLNKHGVFPSKEVLENALGKVYLIFEELETCLEQDESAFTLDWIYSDTTKSWTCKVCSDTDVVFWISVYAGFFKALFFFTERRFEGISDLDISENIKNDFFRAEPVGNLFPLRINVTHKEQLSDLLKIIKFKVKLS